VVALVLPPGIEYLLAYCAAGQVRCDHHRRERPALPTRTRRVLMAAEPALTLNDAPNSTTSAWPTVRRRLPPDSERPVAIIFTSGTTGLPKGALYCNRQLAFITADRCR
jgi:acyl-CoA synthetase (AMP-forming)/AMP-acid ligase II